MPKEDPTVERAIKEAEAAPAGVQIQPLTLEVFPVQVGVGKAPDGTRVLSFMHPPFNFVIHVPEQARSLIVREFSGGVVLP